MFAGPQLSVVTPGANLWKAFEYRADMAGFTRNVLMPPFQRKAGRVVIEIFGRSLDDASAGRKHKCRNREHDNRARVEHNPVSKSGPRKLHALHPNSKFHPFLGERRVPTP